MKLRYAGLTHVGMKRTHNEDNLALLPEESLYIVADGMGGHASGEVASQMAVETITSFFRMTTRDEEVTWPFKEEKNLRYDENRLVAAIKFSNQRIYEAAAREARFKGMGTTIVTAFFTQGGAYLGHVGDSRGYRIRDSDIEQITDDHSLLNDYIKANKLTPEEIENFPHKNVIVRALGMKDTVQVDVNRLDPKVGDYYLLCSDGLSGMISDEEIRDLHDRVRRSRDGLREPGERGQLRRRHRQHHRDHRPVHGRLKPVAKREDDRGEELVRRFRRGDETAFNEIFRTYRSLVYGVLHHLMPHDPELEDVVQQAFIEVFRSLDSFEGRSKLSSWIARVALHVGYHHLRRKKSRPHDYDAERSLPEVMDPSPRGDPEAAAERNEAILRVHAILETLPEKKRTVFILNDLQGMAQEEVAEVVGTNIATVRTRLFYARREFWKKAEQDPVLARILDAGGGGVLALQKDLGEGGKK